MASKRRSDGSSKTVGKIRKGTFSCWECKRRKKPCTPSPRPGVCNTCLRLGDRCIGQEHDEPVDEHGVAVPLLHRLSQLEQLASSLAHRKRKRLDCASPRNVGSLCGPLTGAGEDRLSRCRSLTGYFLSVLPHPFVATLILEHGKAAYSGIKDPLRLSKLSNRGPDGGSMEVEVALLARKLIRLGISLMYIDSTAPESMSMLGMDSDPVEMAHRYAKAAQRLTCEQELLQSTAGLECVMMQGYYKVHLGHIEDAGVSFRRALNLAQRIRLPEQAAGGADGASASRIACFRLLMANRSLSLYNGSSCDDLGDGMYQPKDHGAAQPEELLHRTNLRVWRRLIQRNQRLERSWREGHDRDTALHAEIEETLSIDQDMKRVMLSLPPTWWLMPSPATDVDGETTEKSFSHLSSTKDHYYTIVLTHLPYVVQAFSAGSRASFTYSRSAAVSAGREVLQRFPLYQQFKHVPASLRAVEHKTYVAGVVLLLAHMGSHRANATDPIDHERPKDLAALVKAIEAMECVFARDRHNPGSPCACTLRHLLEVEHHMACGVSYEVACFYEQPYSGSSLGGDDHTVDVRLPYFGTLRIQKSVDADGLAGLSLPSFEILPVDHSSGAGTTKLRQRHFSERRNGDAHVMCLDFDMPSLHDAQGINLPD